MDKTKNKDGTINVKNKWGNEKSSEIFSVIEELLFDLSIHQFKRNKLIKIIFGGTDINAGTRRRN